jgi:hypothetical protein
VRLIVFCEAPADFQTTTALVDRVLHSEGPAWVADLVHSHPESIRASGVNGEKNRQDAKGAKNEKKEIKGSG